MNSYWLILFYKMHRVKFNKKFKTFHLPILLLIQLTLFINYNIEMQ